MVIRAWNDTSVRVKWKDISGNDSRKCNSMSGKGGCVQRGKQEYLATVQGGARLLGRQ